MMDIFNINNSKFFFKKINTKIFFVKKQLTKFLKNFVKLKKC